MNIMKIAHSDTKDYMAQQARIVHKDYVALTYRQVFSAMLKNAHWFYKNEKAKAQPTIKLAVIGVTLEVNKDATWFSLEGTATDSEGNKISIGEGGSHAYVVQHGADWYFNHNNGFTNIDLHACRWGLEDVKESFKIIR